MSGNKRIDIDVNPVVEIDGTFVAQGLGLEVAEFQRLMESHGISVLCERGTGEDEGLYRASFYHGDRRVRLVVDRNGIPVDAPRKAEARLQARPPGRRVERPAAADDADPAPPVIPNPRSG